jgi:hypothetical protein
MKTDVILAVERLMDYCNDRWVEADRPSATAFPTVDMLTGKKMAYNDVMQFARTLLSDLDESARKQLDNMVSDV